MTKLEYKRKPSCCPKCGGEVYELLYGMPNVGKEQELLERGIRYIYAGCAITEGQRPKWQCSECQQQFYKLESLRNTSSSQKIADEEAIRNGYLCAEYLGSYKGKRIYRRIYNDNFEREEGLPILMSIKNGKLSYIYDDEAFKVLGSLSKHVSSRGKAIFRQLEKKYERGEYDNDEEELFVSEIVSCTRYNGYEPPVPKEEVYKFLEIGERLHRKVVIVPDPPFLSGDALDEYIARHPDLEDCRDLFGSREGQCDGWTYHPELE